MPDLEAKLRDLAARGEFTHLSVCTVAGPGPHTVVFSASYTPATADGTGFGRDADPVKAIEKALADDRLPTLKKLLMKNAARKVAEPADREPWEA